MSAIQEVGGAINQLQATAVSARAQEPLPQPIISFAGQLHVALDRISGTQTAARTQAEKFTLSEPGVALSDVTTDMQKASVSMQMGIQVRNKLTMACQEAVSIQVQVLQPVGSYVPSARVGHGWGKLTLFLV